MLYLSTAITLLLHETGVFWNLKKLIHEDYYKYRKPYDCFFCMSFWTNSILLVTLCLLNFELQLLRDYGIVILITKTIDLLWNKRL